MLDGMERFRIGLHFACILHGSFLILRLVATTVDQAFAFSMRDSLGISLELYDVTYYDNITLDSL